MSQETAELGGGQAHGSGKLVDTVTLREEETKSLFGLFGKRPNKLVFSKKSFCVSSSKRKMMGKKRKEIKVNVVVTVDVSSQQVFQFQRIAILRQ